MRLLLILILSTPIFALAAPTIKVSSFVMNDSSNFQDTSAEICGVITDTKKKHRKVVIISDPGRSQGYYVANVAPTGHFCHVIRTRTRQASVNEFIQNREPRRPRSTKVYSITN